MAVFNLEIDGQGIAVLTINRSDHSLNYLGRQGFLELEEFLSREDEREIIENEEEEIRAVVLLSGKEDSFISGADVREFLEIASSDEGRSMSLRVQDTFSRIENFRVPFVSAIHGACLGLGLEISLACAYRIATDDPRTIFGFPEVKLGLIPQGGGAQRLTRLVGIRDAIDMITGGREITHKHALKIGLLDEVVPKEILPEIAKKRAFQISRREVRPHRRSAVSFRRLICEKNFMGRKVLFKRARKSIMNNRLSNHAAPLMALESIEVGMNSSFNRGLHVESVYFSELAASDISRQLIKLNLAEEDTKRDPVIQNPDIKPRQVGKVAIVGAGLIGSAAAVCSALAGVTVRLKGRDIHGAGRGLKSCRDYFEDKVRREDITRLEMERRLNLISATYDYSGFRRADVVIEAVPEDLELKKIILQQVDSVTNEACIFLSTTSSLPIAQITGKARRPENTLGVHFSFPIDITRLLEISVTKDASEQTIATVLEFGRRLGKTPIVVKDTVGFYTTRILTPYLNEAINLLEEGATVDGIDAVMIEFGFPIGPLMLLEERGIYNRARDAEILYQAFGERLKPPLALAKLIQDGGFGTGKKGFYTDNGKKRVDSSVYKLFPLADHQRRLSKEEVQDRLSMAMINEAVLCLEEGVIRSPRDGDVAAVLGVGFPPFLGGPFRYIDTVGAGLVLKKLEHLASDLGASFNPASLLNDLATRGKRFYTD